MAMFKSEYGSSQTKQVLIAGVEGKVILVTRICISTASSGAFTPLSDPDGPAEEQLSATLRAMAATTVDIVLGREYGLAAGRGKALGWTSVVGGPNCGHGITMWYELVD
jgi:hypothetical protein